ncbi:MAG: alkaline phosphatase family protein [Candidatus Woesearchaeota archaeon]
MKTIFVIIDGGADRPSSALGGKTPFEFSNTPNLDFFASEGKLGTVYTVDKGIAPQSDIAIACLLGNDPYGSYPGRGPLEALGAGIRLGKNFLALRTNIGTTEGKKLIDRRVGRTLTTNEALELEKAINKEVKLKCRFRYKSTIEHRGALVLYGKFSDQISNVDPAYEKKGSFGVAKRSSSMELQKCEPLSPEAEETAAIINSFMEQSIKLLKNHPVNRSRKRKGLLPANVILPRDAGNKNPSLKKRKGWAAIVGMPLEKGIAMASGISVLNFSYPPIEDTDTYSHLYESLATSIKYSCQLLNKNWKKYSSFYIHFKETDIPGHDDRPLDKVKMIEMIDAGFFTILKEMKGFRLIVTCDHSTPCAMRAHSADAVPVLLYGKGKDSMARFTEANATKGELGNMVGKELLKTLMK